MKTKRYIPKVGEKFIAREGKRIALRQPSTCTGHYSNTVLAKDSQGFKRTFRTDIWTFEKCDQ